MSAAVVTLGETMALFRPADPTEGENASDYRLSFGGAESNVAVGVVRLGGRAVWMGRVGDDVAGRRILRELRAEGVDLHVTVDAEGSTGSMMKTEIAPGRVAVQYWRERSAGSRLRSDDLDLSMLTSSTVLHVTGITPALSASASETIDAAVSAARSVGATVSFDVNHRPSLWRGRDARPVYRRLAAQSDLVFAGREEAALIVGEMSDDDLVDAIAALGPSTVALKRGAEGATVRAEGRLLERPAWPIHPVDTVGAGDAFVAGYLAEHLKGAPLESRVDTAVAAGAFACLGRGDWESLPHRRQLELLAAGDGDPVVR
ncbi:2-dehydro-3-deoxygluconokinase [Microbacterium sp. ru370.1]|uniref:sugar kinase n=1 Tax=unclassified Microbacterium TaxID=2609290 RepID=UPI00087ECFFF|nr:MULTISPECIES: sugar kinase [unclassified Microbacterium]SDO48717.1 2-dehydro-3-deoxygluconokinase [Microbacterium sp. ru370.1]SIT82525.1 2-dehydro-3-deoxygluconokinase [Microbacterium sp. RU1D]